MKIARIMQRALASISPEGGQRLAQALAFAGLGGLKTASPADLAVPPRPKASPPRAQTGTARLVPGSFDRHTYRCAEGSRDYKLFVPATPHAGPRPLLVLLHGCQQTPDDFAAGTRINALAETQGFVVAYPEQSRNDNGANCWNWFRAQDQERDGGEPALIAGIVREVCAASPIDRGRIFVAGLSAGASMAVILGQTYPDLFRAVGAHSGLPYRAANDVGSAFAAMSGPGMAPQRGAAPKGLTLPVIVFHGDQDTTVNARNGHAIVTQALAATGAWRQSVQRHAASGSRDCTTTVHADAQGRPHIEHWLIHGAGHAWSGGHASGSFTEAGGPDASAQMLRFFMAQRA